MVVVVNSVGGCGSCYNCGGCCKCGGHCNCGVRYGYCWHCGCVGCDGFFYTRGF